MQHKDFTRGISFFLKNAFLQNLIKLLFRIKIIFLTNWLKKHTHSQLKDQK